MLLGSPNNQIQGIVRKSSLLNFPWPWVPYPSRILLASRMLPSPGSPPAFLPGLLRAFIHSGFSFLELLSWGWLSSTALPWTVAYEWDDSFPIATSSPSLELQKCISGCLKVTFTQIPHKRLKVGHPKWSSSSTQSPLCLPFPSLASEHHISSNSLSLEGTWESVFAFSLNLIFHTGLTTNYWRLLLNIPLQHSSAQPDSHFLNSDHYHLLPGQVW